MATASQAARRGRGADRLCPWQRVRVRPRADLGIGPRVIWKDGLGIEIQLDQLQFESLEPDEQPEELWALDYEFLYGLTPNQAITLEVPQVLRRQTAGAQNGGLGDLVLRYKGRFYRRDVAGGAYMASALGGIKFPTGESGRPAATGSGTYDAFAGLAADYEGRRWLVFGTGRYKRNGTTERASKSATR